jgi:hypothetical protein
MWIRVLGVAAIAAVATSVVANVAGGRQAPGWKRLITAPAIGSWDWRCDRSGRFAARFVVAPGTATTDVRVVVAGRSRGQRLAPGRSLTTSLAAVEQQKWVVVQATEPRTLNASLTIVFRQLGAPTGDCYVPSAKVALSTVSHSAGG